MKKTNYIEQLLLIVRQKQSINQKMILEDPDKNSLYQEFLESEHYFEAIKDETDEAYAENKNENHIYLEDELCDILWDYTNLLHFLESEDKISSIDAVFARAITKFGERTTALEKGITWDIVKEKQKKWLEQQHHKKYSK